MVQPINKWIILRGLGRGYGHWGSFQEKMRAAFSKDKIYFLDLPGNGLLNKEKSPLNISSYISFLEMQLKKTDFHQTQGNVYGVGLSLGGMVMTEWATQSPQLFTKIFLINTSASNFSKPWKRISFLVFMNSVKQIFTTALENFELNSLVVTTSLTANQIKTEFKSDYESNIEFSRQYPITKRNILRQLLAASKYFFPITMNTPVLIINGACDRFVNPGCSIDIQKKWNSEIVTHPTAGHDIAFEDSRWLIEVFSRQV